MAFDPDKYLAESEGGFDPDAYLNDVQSEPADKGFSVEGLGRGALEALPIAGSLVGGAIGATAGALPTLGLGGAPGAVIGAGLGAGAGKALEQAGKEFFFNESPENRYSDIAKETALGATSEMGGQVASKLMSEALPFAKKASTKVAQALTGVPEQEIKTYAKNADKIKELAKASDSSTIEAADIIRNKYAKDIQSTKSGLNEVIENVLPSNPKRISSEKIIDSLVDYKSKINPKLYPEQIGQIDELISKVNSLTQDGTMSALEAHQLKQFLQDKASSAYSNPGDIFSLGTEAAKAAKGAAAQARLLINEAIPEVAQANNQLSKLHNIEDSMNINLLKIGSPESALMAAGSGGNPRNARALEKLGKMTGTPMLEEAQNLAAMRTFANPPLLPVDVTGKSGARMDFAKAGIGAIGGAVGGGPIGAAIGTAATSPAALKYGIDVGRGVSKVGTKALELIPESIKNLIPMDGGAREILYKSLIQKSLQKKEEKKDKFPDQTSFILDKVKGSPYEQVLRNSASKGAQSLAAANYVLKSRDPRYRELFDEQV